MKKTSTTQNRRILQVPVDTGVLQDSASSPAPISQLTNGSSETNTTRNPKQPNATIDSSMALPMLVIILVLFFMCLFSIYISRAPGEGSDDVRRRRHPARPSSSPLKCAGVDRSIIQSLPLVSYCNGSKQLTITACPICLSEFEEREIIKLIPRCRHVFHPLCIDTWLASHESCPLCRTTQFSKAGDDDQVGLDVEEEEHFTGMSDHGGRSTVQDSDTWRVLSMRGTCSCASLKDRPVLQRSLSF